MGCSRSQLLALLSRIRREIYTCSTIECARKIIDEYLVIVRDNAELEAFREILRP